MTRYDEQPDIIEPKVAMGALVWYKPYYDCKRGKIVKIYNDTVVVDYKDCLSSYPVSDIKAEFISPFLVLVAGDKETIIHRHVI